MANIILEEDLQSISNVLYTPVEEELKHRQIFALDESYDPDAMEIGYDVFERTGAAKLIAGRAGAKDIAFVGEKKTRTTQKTYEIATGIQYKRSEISSVNAARRLGKGPAVSLDMLRPAAARRYCFEVENRVCWVGDTNYNIKGFLHDDWYGPDPNSQGLKEFVAQGATGGSAAEKRKWKNKTPQEIIEDLTKPVEYIEASNIFRARTLIIPGAQMTRLKKPFGSDTAQTLLSYLTGPGQYFDNVVVDNRLKAGTAASGGNGDSVDYFMVIDNRPEVAAIATLRDIFMLDPVYNLVGDSEQAVLLTTGGPLFRYPCAAYIGKGV